MEEKNKMSISKKAKNILAKIERLREEAKKKGMYFDAPSEDDILRKLKKKETPFFVGQGWTSAPPGGTVNYSVTIYNPDDFRQTWLYCHVFVGPACILKDVGQAVLAVDPRFARLTEPDYLGLRLQPNEYASLNFSLPVPANIERTKYLGNCFLFKAKSYDGFGKCLDRLYFVFIVT